MLEADELKEPTRFRTLELGQTPNALICSGGEYVPAAPSIHKTELTTSYTPPARKQSFKELCFAGAQAIL